MPEAAGGAAAVASAAADTTSATGDAVRLSLDEATELAARALRAANTAADNAAVTARALVRAEADGQRGHGLSRVPSYAAQARVGKVDGFAKPRRERVAAAVARIDAGSGFAYPAIEMALESLTELAAANGVAAASIFRSHHFGQAGAHAERLAERGLIALVFGNSPKAIALWGGRQPLLGTNPIAFAAPLPPLQESSPQSPSQESPPPLVIDLAMSVAARGKIMAAQKSGAAIPGDWALDQAGRPTTDPAAAMQGSMLAIGGAKGAALALMVEILSAALTASQFGFEASSLFDDQGAPPNLGQVILALDPETLSGGGFMPRMRVLLDTIGGDEETRLPGARRLQAREQARLHGLSVPMSLYDEIQGIIAHG